MSDWREIDEDDRREAIDERRIFVFGSNLAGRHGAGSARAAYRHHGAKMGQGVGLQGNSYGIPTKNEKLAILPLSAIMLYVADFLAFASERPTWQFDLVAIGCGLAGYEPADIAPMFKGATVNVHLPREFTE